jgi:hypothetical protein
MSFIPLYIVTSLLENCSEKQRRIITRLHCRDDSVLRAMALVRSDDRKLWNWFANLPRNEALMYIPYLRVISRIYTREIGSELPEGLITDDQSFRELILNLGLDSFPLPIYPDGEGFSAIISMSDLLERLIPTEVGDIAYGIWERRVSCYKAEGQGFLMVRDARVLIACCGPRYLQMDTAQERRLRAWCKTNRVRR